jgi:hypothetical protein
LSRFSANAAPSLGLGNSAILPSLLVSDPFHQTLNAAIVDFHVHGQGGSHVFSRLFLSYFIIIFFMLLRIYILQVGCSKLKMESGELTSTTCQ